MGEMREKWAGRIMLAALIGLLVCIPFLGQTFYMRLGSRMMIYAMAALSLDLLVGYGGMVSLGHAAFFGVGAYTVGILAHHGVTEALVAWPAAMGLAALLALPIGAVSLRTSGAYFIMITLAFAQMIYYFVFGLQQYGGSDGMPMASRNTLAGVLQFSRHEHFYVLCAVMLVVVFVVSRRLVRSPFGATVSGIRENEARMRSLGYPTYRYKLACFVISSAVAALAGALAANLTLYLSPSLMHWTQSGHFLVMVILGGMGTCIGPVTGACALLLAEEVLSSVTEHWMMILGPLLILVVLFARRGLYGALAGAGRHG